MALFVLVILGISLGWFSSVLARTETAKAILRQIGVGIIAALAGGLALNGGSVIGGLSFWGLGAGVAACVVALVMYHAIITRSEQGAL